MNSEMMGPVQPWWRIRMRWLARGGPALVVGARVVTLGVAFHGRDRPLLETGAAEADSQTPATQARNHVVAARR